MPYYIEKNNPDCKSGWMVVDAGGAAFGCHPTKQGAIDQAVAISLSTDEPFVGERAAINSLKPGDFVTWDATNPEILAEVFMVSGEVAVLELYELEDGVYSSTEKLMIYNILKLSVVPKPEFIAEKIPEPAAPADPAMPESASVRDAEGADIILSDIDGTLLNGGSRNQRVWDYIQSLDGALFILTGRPESERAATEQDLASADITYSRLIMNNGSTADSPSFKKAKAEELLQTYNIVAAIENNAETLTKFRELGIDAYAPGDVPLSEDRALNQEAPAYMRVAARRGLEYYAQGLAGDGVVDRTIREAHDMAEGRVSDDKWIRIAAWIARHMVDLDSPDANPSSENYPSAGVVAHLLWGSGPSKRAAERTLAYAQSVVDRIRAEQERDSMNTDTRAKWADVATAIVNRLEGRSTPKHEERVNVIDLEVRESGDGMTFSGYAAVFNSESEDLGGFREFIAPGAFKRSLQSRNEVKLLWNHDAGEPLASMRGGTLKLTEDATGLKVEARLANTSRGRDVAELIRSKTVDSMSFGFSVIKDTWNNEGNVRTLNAVRLFEISLVSWPAYQATSGTVSIRSSQTINADQLADALFKLESGEELDPTAASLITDVVAKLTKTEEVQEVEGDILALKKKKLDLLLKGI